MEAYCVKCKTKREIKDPQPVFTASAVPATKGVCPVCGTGLYRMGNTPAHEGMQRPEPLPRASRNGKRARKNKAVKRKGKLVIVESPAKAKTVGRFLGKGYTVKASIGHVRDLLRSQLSVDVENDFKPKYRVPNDKKDVVKDLTQQGQRAEEIYLATDPDREGEAIAWHLTESADFEPERIKRVVFHEITQNAIRDAFDHPREINMELVNAQQARRILDRLVGYKLSPLLWEKVRGRLSAGRVQSVALRLVVEREREIQAFVPVEYWSIHAQLAQQIDAQLPKDERASFLAKLVKIRGNDVDLKNENDTQAIVNELEKSDYVVAGVRKSERRRKPKAPYTTSTMQQEASRKLGYSARRTMALAQQLYEGIALGEEGATGLITYMRTDSTQVSEMAQNEAREFIRERYGEEYLPESAPKYTTRSKGAQEAHEAIRPTSVMRTPEEVKSFLDKPQFKLYSLIWKRFVASQMLPAVYDTVAVDVAAGEQNALRAVIAQLGDNGVNKVVDQFPYLFRATGSTLKFAGYLAVYEEAREEDVRSDEDDEGARIPELSVDELLDLLQLLPEQHFTEPPPRYTEATLVKALEENGIGRPSTYAPILGTIQNRGYVEKVDKRLTPTDIGFIVSDMLVEHFGDVVDVGFTARIEDEFDEIASGDKEWVEVLREFYEPFEQDLERASHAIEKVKVDEEIGEDCPVCGKPLIVRWGRFGKFIGCSDYPTCRYTRPFLFKIGVCCPLDGGELVQKKTRRGRIFYGCENWPECEFSSWNKPLPQPCPNCAGLLTMKGKDAVKCIQCENEYPLNELPELEGQPESEPALR